MIFGQHDFNTLDQFDNIRKGVAVRAALMADGHYGYVMPVGGVAAYRNAVSVMGVGFDIACGNCAIKTNLNIEDITRQKLNIKDVSGNPHYVMSDKYLCKFADAIEAHVSFGIGRSNLSDDAPTDHALFADPRWSIIANTEAQRDDLREKARNQLGTVGSGNHYVDVFTDAIDGTVWVGVHFGSRGLGHTIASNYLAIGQGGSWGDRGKEVETILDLDTQDGKDYWDLMSLAGDYAYAGREWVARKTVELLGGEVVDMVHNHHNFAWKETHGVPTTKGESFMTPLINYTTEELVVVRKGATPAWPGQRGFVGGSMGDNAVILEGTQVGSAGRYEDFGLPEGLAEMQSDALYSTVHGAGRVMSRTEAAGKWSRAGVQKKIGKISHDMRTAWLNKTGVVLRGAGLDEAPQAYRRLPDVLMAQGDTVTVTNTLKPVIVVMARANERDPYKD